MIRYLPFLLLPLFFFLFIFADVILLDSKLAKANDVVFDAVDVADADADADTALELDVDEGGGARMMAGLPIHRRALLLLLLEEERKPIMMTMMLYVS